jgi:hypothetical protein
MLINIGKLVLFKTASTCRSLLYFLFTRLYISETSNFIGCLILAHCITEYLEPRLCMRICAWLRITNPWLVNIIIFHDLVIEIGLKNSQFGLQFIYCVADLFVLIFFFIFRWGDVSIHMHGRATCPVQTTWVPFPTLTHMERQTDWLPYFWPFRKEVFSAMCIFSIHTWQNSSKITCN